ncbi:MAG: hypothetical protein ACRDRG_19625 [Pseudonocardiaceae bacterium]
MAELVTRPGSHGRRGDLAGAHLRAPCRLYHSGVAARWPLTGRSEDLTLISGLTTRRDAPAGVVLAGPAGVGKTRLAREALTAATRGNVLYLRQLVDGELESTRLRQVAGVWQWSGRPELSPGLVELVRSRIGRLPDAQRAVLEVLAFGEPLGVPLLAGLTDAAAVEQVEARGLVEVYPDRRRLQARLAHPLYGEVQWAQMGQLHARRLRGQIACALAATGARRAGDTLRRALLALESDLVPDPVLLTAAARRVGELGDCPAPRRLNVACVPAPARSE